ncbi:ABC transporter ATP-binding protein [Segniliparus rugosus]|uniref:ABC transporter ATP-binding protein n=1 Tax=Segniliparus rugosus (strain ATCC BAA-974 / DSM 45345 / CCUG 50838 / CIP 108380 / JCM 13579 / CDC 945) TaxID=679197 RepID=E5XNV5_SEGRC|nr:ABC transporter ATP-binding protein [Segniliparus rugosus]EFV13983.1 hypothetical protein HMPREF9336_01176 [Segniliparus rugosus ATCC BAA-974]
MAGEKAAGAERTKLFEAVRGRIFVIAALSLAGSACSVVPLIAISELAKTLWPAFEGGAVDEGGAWAMAVLAAVALAVSLVAAGLSGVVSHLADNDLQLDLRTKIVQKLRELPLGWFGDRSSGEVRKVAESDVSAVHSLIAHGIGDIVTAVAVPVLSLAYLFATQWRMALVCLVPIVVTMVVYSVAMRGGQEQLAAYESSVAKLGSAAVEFVHGIAVVKTFGQIGRSHSRYQEAVGEFVGFYRDSTRRSSLGMGVVTLITSPVVVLVYLSAVSAWLVGAGAVTPVEVVPALLLGLGLTAPLLQLGASGKAMYNAMQSKASLVEFFAQPTIPQPERPVAPEGHAVGFDSVSFSYDGDRQVLNEIAAQCAPGTTTALVGPSGSGKSTLARLVPRFYDATGGSVSVGGADVRAIAADQLYGTAGFVFQDVYLLRTSVRDNIRLTRPDADDAAVERAARGAQIHDRILRLPRGYDSVIGEDAHLSGGEGQRLTIARALVTDAPVLVLDEATAFADPDSEAAIQEALSTLAEERTLLVIAHRLHTIVGADQILVLDGGRVVERGSHAELTAKGGLYSQMWDRYSKAHAATTPQGADR